jgi:hypothetical protein
MIFPAVFAIVVGFGMIAMWTGSYLSKQIPELEDEPIRIKFHLAAEFITALLLAAAGFALFLNLDWAVSAYLIAIGMLFYTVVVSPGYFAQKGQWGYVVMFAVILILGMVNLFIVLGGEPLNISGIFHIIDEMPRGG